MGWVHIIHGRRVFELFKELLWCIFLRFIVVGDNINVDSF